MKEITLAEVSKHNTEKDCWIIIDDKVYDVTKFAGLHPGGEQILLSYGGKDATEDFFGLHRYEVLKKYEKRLLVGVLEGRVEKDTPEFGDLSVVPFAEPPFWRGFHSKYYNQSHYDYRLALRKIIAEYREIAEEYEVSCEQIPQEIQHAFGKTGFYAAQMGHGEHQKYVDHLPGGIKPEKFDMFHEMITQEELFRLPTPGFIDGLVGGRSISIPVLLKFGNQWMKDEVASKSLRGEINTCLAITEPFAGSDVAGVRCTAVKSPCGKFYIVNGVKKWITQGHSSQYFITAVRTGKDRQKGVSVLLIERGEGVHTKLIKTSYSTAAGTALIIFENVKVPVENLIGEENGGFKIVMYNFNHERWAIVVGLLSKSRFMLEECFKWANQRIIFGKKLIDQPVIQEKLAIMSSRLEACYAWLESVTYQMNSLSFDEMNKKVGGDIALLKLEAANVGNLIAAEAVQIFGGRGMTRTGMGANIERFQAMVKLPGVYGGASEIMASLGVKQAVKAFPKHAKL